LASCGSPPADITLTPVTEPDFPVLRQLADTIWRQHYVGIISVGQIDYMLAGRFSDEALGAHMQAADKWLELLQVSGTPVGYCGFREAVFEIGGGFVMDDYVMRMRNWFRCRST
jgi:hypothetical protein